MLDVGIAPKGFNGATVGTGRYSVGYSANTKMSFYQSPCPKGQPEYVQVCL